MLSLSEPLSPLDLTHGDSPRRLIMVSNRGPIEHSFDESGRIAATNAAGGVAVALANVARWQSVTWIAAAASDADRAVAILGQPIAIGADSSLKLLDPPAAAYHAFYETFCNPILWFTQHSLGELLRGRNVARQAVDSWHEGYLPVNQAFAEAVVDEIPSDGAGTRVMLHDYHLYLAPRLIRAVRPKASLQHFVHIPWPGPAAWRRLPEPIVRGICAGLLANDSVVFQTDEGADNFLATCRAYLGASALVLERQGSVEHLGQTTFVWSNPVSVDPTELSDQRALPALEQYRRSLAAPPDVSTIVRVDRLDPTKNVADGFEAYDLLLRRHRELRSKVRFLAFLIPSRDSIPEYCHYKERVLALAESINQRYGTPEWQPVTVYLENNRTRALAALTLHDVLLVNSLADGLNLVSKEGSLLNERDGVLALSDMAGSYQELHEAALRVNPHDIVDTATTLYQALTMSASERKHRADQLRRIVSDHQASDWLKLLLKDLAISEHLKRIEARTAV